MAGCEFVFSDSSPEDMKKQRKLHDNYRHEIFETKEDADVEIIVDGSTIKAHRIVLKAHDFFKKLFQNMPSANGQIPRIVLNAAAGTRHHNVHTVSKMLEFMYKNQVHVNDDEAVNLLFLADQYSIIALTERCERHLIRTWTVQNIADRYLYACRANAKKLECFASEKIEENLKAVKDTDGFKNLKANGGDSFTKLLVDMIDELSPRKRQKIAEKSTQHT